MSPKQVGKLLEHFLTANKTETNSVPGVDTATLKQMREALRTLGILRDVRGEARGLVCEVNYDFASKFADILEEVAEDAEVHQRRERELLR